MVAIVFESCDRIFDEFLSEDAQKMLIFYLMWWNILWHFYVAVLLNQLEFIISLILSQLDIRSAVEHNRARKNAL